MKIYLYKILFAVAILSLTSCKKNENPTTQQTGIANNEIEYASGLAIYKYEQYSLIKVSNPWPNAATNFTYILKEKGAVIPDTLQKYTTIRVPLETIVVTSTTNIPFLEMIGAENKLVGFPHTDYVSSKKTRRLIDNGSVKNIGQNEKLNIEQLIDLDPDLIVTFGIDNNNPMIENLQKSGLKILIQADWMEQSPLGKAEWIKLYGVLFGKEKEAKILFDQITKNYNEAIQLVADQKPVSTVLYGSMYQDQWFVAKGNSWVAQFIKDAKGTYLWANLEGTGSQALSYEQVLDQAKNATHWIATGSFKTLSELEKSNPHYSQFTAFSTKNIYTFENKLGSKGGTIYYETGPSRPDLILKDYIKIFHPELLPNYAFTFAQKIN
jgi:iron complex transport system substrate-binding protein